MTKYLRYTLAALFFAMSVGCLALWGWTVWNENTCVNVRYFGYRTDADNQSSMFGVEVMQGEVVFRSYENSFVARGWKIDTSELRPFQADAFRDRLSKLGLFFIAEPWTYFPLWYPALIFALASVGILRVGRFTIRSALIATAIVALLLGMVVVL